MTEADELWSSVGSGRDRRWVWVALDADTRQVVAVAAGGRDGYTARCPWDALPDGYRDGAVVCTDLLAAYRAVVPEGRHAAGEEAGPTCHAERFRCTLRRRCARFVRKTLSFSKCPENHVGALWYFIRLYNACRMEGHYLFAAFLSTGKDHRDCGRPCDAHKVELRDRVGAAFPVVPDAGCRNTVFNSPPQSAAEHVGRMLGLGVRRLRVDLLRETPDGVGALLTRYARVAAGADDGRSVWRQLRALSQLGVTRGTLQVV